MRKIKVIGVTKIMADKLNERLGGQRTRHEGLYDVTLFDVYVNAGTSRVFISNANDNEIDLYHDEYLRIEI